MILMSMSRALASLQGATEDRSNWKKRKPKPYNPKPCAARDCQNMARRGDAVCIKHGARKRICNHEGCQNQVQNNGVCRKHGARVNRCRADGCPNEIKRSGFCKTHLKTMGSQVEESTEAEEHNPDIEENEGGDENLENNGAEGEYDNEMEQDVDGTAAIIRAAASTMSDAGQF